MVQQVRLDDPGSPFQIFDFMKILLCNKQCKALVLSPTQQDISAGWWKEEELEELDLYPAHLTISFPSSYHNRHPVR